MQGEGRFALEGHVQARFGRDRLHQQLLALDGRGQVDDSCHRMRVRLEVFRLDPVFAHKPDGLDAVLRRQGDGALPQGAVIAEHQVPALAGRFEKTLQRPSQHFEDPFLRRHDVVALRRVRGEVVQLIVAGTYVANQLAGAGPQGLKGVPLGEGHPVGLVTFLQEGQQAAPVRCARCGASDHVKNGRV